jgi:predicted small metal-binding protein
MAMRVSCEEDLRIEGCDLVVEGEVAGDVAEEVVTHLREEHDMDVPDAETIVAGDVDEEALDKEVRTLTRRLREALALPEEEGLEAKEDPDPATMVRRR